MVPSDTSSASSISSTLPSGSGRPRVETGGLSEIGERLAGFAGEPAGRGSPAPEEDDEDSGESVARSEQGHRLSGGDDASPDSSDDVVS